MQSSSMAPFTDWLADDPPWFCNPQLLRAARDGAKHLVLLPWIICYAKAADDRGRLTTHGEPATAAEIAQTIPGVGTARVCAALGELFAFDLLGVDEDGAFAFPPAPTTGRRFVGLQFRRRG
jgi:hypothetical protein